MFFFRNHSFGTCDSQILFSFDQPFIMEKGEREIHFSEAIGKALRLGSEKRGEKLEACGCEISEEELDTELKKQRGAWDDLI